jgi:hypothetical protein
MLALAIALTVRLIAHRYASSDADAISALGFLTGFLPAVGGAAAGGLYSRSVLADRITRAFQAGLIGFFAYGLAYTVIDRSSG